MAATVRDRVGPIARGHTFQGARVKGREGRRAPGAGGRQT